VVGHGREVPEAAVTDVAPFPWAKRSLSCVERYIPSSERFGLEGIAADLSRFVARVVELDA
jgi:hypothetical protein